MYNMTANYLHCKTLATLTIYTSLSGAARHTPTDVTEW